MPVLGIMVRSSLGSSPAANAKETKHQTWLFPTLLLLGDGEKKRKKKKKRKKRKKERNAKKEKEKKKKERNRRENPTTQRASLEGE